MRRIPFALIVTANVFPKLLFKRSLVAEFYETIFYFYVQVQSRSQLKFNLTREKPIKIDFPAFKYYITTSINRILFSAFNQTLNSPLHAPAILRAALIIGI